MEKHRNKIVKTFALNCGVNILTDSIFAVWKLGGQAVAAVMAVGLLLLEPLTRLLRRRRRILLGYCPGRYPCIRGTQKNTIQMYI